MAKFIVKGGLSLSGIIQPQGSKNEALQVICATLLTNEPIILHNIPTIADIQIILELLVALKIDITHLGDNSYRFCAAPVDASAMFDPEFRRQCAKVRGSVMLFGPLLTRFERVIISKPGGDRIGRRGLHAHFEGLAKLGIQFSYDADELVWCATRKTLQGDDILMSEASVTGTANILMAASLSHGKTTIYNAACEPHVQQLCHMLVAMGASITGIGTNLLIIEGVPKLGGTTHRIRSDMLEIGSFVGLAAVTRSTLTITDVPIECLSPIYNCFRNLFGIKLELEGNTLHIPQQSSYSIHKSEDGALATLSDAIWPGFPTDLLSVMIVVAIHSRGHILIHQKLYESRLFFVDHLIEMGAQLVLCDPHRVHIVGLNQNQKLRGIHMVSSDIRAGITLLIAALAAEGTSVIENIGQIDRGYESIDQRLNKLGASIIRM